MVFIKFFNLNFFFVIKILVKFLVIVLCAFAIFIRFSFFLWKYLDFLISILVLVISVWSNILF